MKKNYFLENMDKVINDFMEHCNEQRLKNALTALIIADTISEKTTKFLFTDGMFWLIEFAEQYGHYRPSIK